MAALPNLGLDYPKWVKVHDSHIVRRHVDGFPDHIIAPDFADTHVNRVDGVVTVLVADEDEEKRAVGARVDPEKAETPKPDNAPKE